MIKKSALKIWNINKNCKRSKVIGLSDKKV